MARAPKVVLATFGTLGDVYPFVALAQALERRGFAPTIVAPDQHGEAIEAEGLRHARMRPNETDIVKALGVDVPGAFRIMLGNPHFILDEIYMRFLRETYDDVLRAGSDAALMITHSLLVGASQAAEKLRVPNARVALAPLHLQSATAPPLTPGAPYVLEPRGRGAVAYNRLVREVVRAVTRSRMGKLREFRQSIGLEASREDVFLDFGRPNTADTIFGLFSRRFSPAQPDHPGNLVVPGFPFYCARDPGRRVLDPLLMKFLNGGEPPIVFTLGSFAPEVSGDFYDRSLRAARALGRRAVLLAGGWDAARLAPFVTEREFVCARAPHGPLFPRALCVVHHGGIGTTAEALRAARPQVVVPFFGDQPDHGARVTRLGLGVTLTLAAYDERSATTALRTVLTGPYAEAARRFATLIADEDGVKAVAEWAERLTSTDLTRPRLP